jgi:hypothetical protein
MGWFVGFCWAALAWCGLGWAWLLLGSPVGLLRQVSSFSSLFYLFSFSALISFAILYFSISGLNF